MLQLIFSPFLQVWKVKIVPLSLVRCTAFNWKKKKNIWKCLQFSLHDSTTCAIKHAPATGNDTTLLFLCPADLESVDGTTVIGKLHKSLLKRYNWALNLQLKFESVKLLPHVVIWGCCRSTVCYDYILLLAGEDDLPNVTSEVAGLAAEWWDLGNSLGVRSSDLNAIRKVYAYYPHTCLTEMLMMWLKQKYNVRIPYLCAGYIWLKTSSWNDWKEFQHEVTS